HYPWHRQYGQTLPVDDERVTALRRERIFLCPLPDGTRAVIPAWMTSRERCATLQLVETPHVSLAVLVRLRAFLASLATDRGHGTIRADRMPSAKEARSDAQSESANPAGLERPGRDALGGASPRRPRPAPRAARPAPPPRRRVLAGGGR